MTAEFCNTTVRVQPSKQTLNQNKSGWLRHLAHMFEPVRLPLFHPLTGSHLDWSISFVVFHLSWFMSSCRIRTTHLDWLTKFMIWLQFTYSLYCLLMAPICQAAVGKQWNKAISIWYFSLYSPIVCKIGLHPRLSVDRNSHSAVYRRAITDNQWNIYCGTRCNTHYNNEPPSFVEWRVDLQQGRLKLVGLSINRMPEAFGRAIIHGCSNLRGCFP